MLSGLKKVKSLLAIFFRRENQRAVKNSFESLVNSQGQEVSSKADLESIRVTICIHDLHVQESFN